MTNRYLKLTAAGISDLSPYVPGKPIEELERELGISDTVKLASNENPLGPSPRGIAAARKVLEGVNLYPDDLGFNLRNKLAEKYQIDANCFILGSGSSDVIDMVSRTFLGPGRNAVFSQYAFAMYPIYTRASGAECRVAKALPPDHSEMPYGHDLDAMSELVDQDTRVVFIANPNNPTGTWLERQALYDFIQSLPDHVIVVLDEAYTEYVIRQDFPNGIEWLEQFPNLLVTRTFSKIYGLAGLRIGFGAANPELAEVVSRVRHPFNVNSAALAAAEYALDDVDFLDQSREINGQGLEQLMTAFSEMGLSYIPSIGNFVSVNVGDGRRVYESLLHKAIIVRPVGNYQMPEFLRVTVGKREENRRLLRALGEVLQ